MGVITRPWASNVYVIKNI